MNRYHFKVEIVIEFGKLLLKNDTTSYNFNFKNYLMIKETIQWVI